mgnify:FL=1
MKPISSPKSSAKSVEQPKLIKEQPKSVIASPSLVPKKIEEAEVLKPSPKPAEAKHEPESFLV